MEVCGCVYMYMDMVFMKLCVGCGMGMFLRSVWCDVVVDNGASYLLWFQVLWKSFVLFRLPRRLCSVSLTKHMLSSHTLFLAGSVVMCIKLRGMIDWNVQS